MRLAAAVLLAAGAALGQERGPVEVRVLGPSGTPLPGIGVGHGRAEGEGGVVGRTDERGVLLLEDLPYDGSVFVSVQDPRLPGLVQATHEGFRPVHVQGAAVTGPRLAIRAHDGVWCEISFVDAETGERVAAVPWALGDLGDAVEPSPQARQIVFGRSLRTGKLPEGYARPDGVSLADRSLFAREVCATVPLRRTILLRLKVLAHDGRPEGEALVAAVTAAGTRTEAALDDLRIADEEGVLTVGPLPFFRDDPVSVEVERHTDEGVLRATWEGRLPATHRAGIDAEVTLPPPAEAVPPDDGFEEPKGNTAIGVARAPPPPAPERGALEVRAVRSGGEPAAWAHVEVRHLAEKGRRHGARLDAKGFARLEGIAAGAWSVTVAGAGLLDASGEARVRDGATEAILLEEPAPGALSVRVVDEAGKPVPCAALDLARPDGFPVGSWDVEDGVQRIDPFTGRDGTRRLAHLPPGPLLIRARYGARRGEARCEVVAGETVGTTVRLGPPR